MGTQFVTGDVVVTAASMTGPNLHQALPLSGMVESVTPGAPPTAVTIAWGDGTRTLYPVVGSGATSVLLRRNTTSTNVLLNRVVQPNAASGIPNPSGRLRGAVAQQFDLEDPNGTSVQTVVVVETPIGVLVTAEANVEVIPSA